MRYLYGGVTSDMKKQITILICVFVAAAVLLGVYLIFFRTGDQTTEDYYKISENALAIGNLEYDKVTITFADSREKAGRRHL